MFLSLVSTNKLYLISVHCNLSAGFQEIDHDGGWCLHLLDCSGKVGSPLGHPFTPPTSLHDIGTDVLFNKYTNDFGIFLYLKQKKMGKNSHKQEMLIMVENFINDELRMRGYNVDVGDVEIRKQILLSSFLQKVLDKKYNGHI